MQLLAVFELPGSWGEGLNPPTVLSTPLTHCQIMFWRSAIYYIGLHTVYITIFVGFRPSKSSTSQLIFHISNTGC